MHTNIKQFVAGVLLFVCSLSNQTRAGWQTELMKDEELPALFSEGKWDCALRITKIPSDWRKLMAFSMTFRLATKEAGHPQAGDVIVKLRIPDGRIVNRSQKLTPHEIQTFWGGVYAEEVLSLPSRQDKRLDGFSTAPRGGVILIEYSDSSEGYSKTIERNVSISHPVNRLLELSQQLCKSIADELLSGIKEEER